MQSKTRWRHADGSRALPLKRIIPLERARGLLQEAMFDANRWESALGAVAEAWAAPPLVGRAVAPGQRAEAAAAAEVARAQAQAVRARERTSRGYAPPRNTAPESRLPLSSTRR